MNITPNTLIIFAIVVAGIMYLVWKIQPAKPDASASIKMGVPIKTPPAVEKNSGSICLTTEKTISCAHCGNPTEKKRAMTNLHESHGYIKFLCPSCYNAGVGRPWMPILVGHPNQIQWANLIRYNELALHPQNPDLQTLASAKAWIDFHESINGK